MNLEPFRSLEREFETLKQQLANGQISRSDYETALDKLTYRDEYGRLWRIDRIQGDWLLRVGDTWKASHPITTPPPETATASTTASASAAPSPTPPSATATAPRASNLIPLIAIGAIALFCVCAVGGLALLNATGIITTQVNLFRTATATSSALLVTPVGSPTVARATTTPASGTPTVAATPATDTPTAATETQTPAIANETTVPTSAADQTFVAFDADFFGGNCPLFEGDNEIRKYACDLGEYLMLHKQATTRYSYVDGIYADAVIEANGYWIKGEGKYEYGVIFRGNEDGTLYYVFTVTQDGMYNVALYKDEKYTDLIPYTPSPAVRVKGDNFFKVVMRGDKFDFYLNDTFLKTVTDSTIPRGIVGLFFYNAQPDAQVGFDQLTISTFTPVTPTATPDANAAPSATTASLVNATTTPAANATKPPTRPIGPTAAIKPGVYVSSLRLNPGAPKRGQPVTFLVTFVNSTGRAQSFKWLVEIWEQNTNKKNPYGQADAQQREIPTGTQERATGNSWKVAGGGPCVPFRARVVYENDQSQRIPFTRTNGAALWVPFQVCP